MQPLDGGKRRRKQQKGGNPILIPLALAAAGPIIARGVSWIIDKIVGKKEGGKKAMRIPKVGKRHHKKK